MVKIIKFVRLLIQFIFLFLIVADITGVWGQQSTRESVLMIMIVLTICVNLPCIQNVVISNVNIVLSNVGANATLNYDSTDGATDRVDQKSATSPAFAVVESVETAVKVEGGCVPAGTPTLKSVCV
ncbi:unnamed protein product [Trifolium pratense]|uniref:Uncharacterized protein n=1 Tax=Trifolium pratense TaxID=57577 RepID=A0ACB0LN58_TRIPR|nr:unnamed protein product [Trifolium pratense]